ncbi:MAG: GntR family transcriptional regulator [Devosia marina]|uniref:GntR family transcriptional regulator n=1 Tax=Devosia marina TaxID=2683198 RepID=A0A7X3FTG7_9HYPH|nr:GntR family transcriptional regulator [Devosia marina]MVT00349.1 GntR family transcriptional regulator [Devosia marina]
MSGVSNRAAQSQRALMGVRDLIVSGELRAGTRLSELILVERLGISRTPLRAALAQLGQEGLVEAIPSGGYAVRSFSREEVIDAIELRGTLEGLALRLAAERGVAPARMGELNRLLEGIDEALKGDVADMDFDGYVDLNAAFHEKLWGLASQTIRREIERVTSLPFASPSAFLDKQANVEAFRRSLYGAQTQHRAMVEAIGLREGSRAEALAREHARLARQNLEFVLDQDRSLIRRVPALSLVVG